MKWATTSLSVEIVLDVGADVVTEDMLLDIVADGVDLVSVKEPRMDVTSEIILGGVSCVVVGMVVDATLGVATGCWTTSALALETARPRRRDAASMS